MSGNRPRVRATPFHVRAADANEANDWTPRNGFTLSRSYSGTESEALAARTRAGLIDISWRWRVRFEGARSGEFLSRLLTSNPARLAPGEAVKALWLADGGGARGAGAIARFGKDSFQLVSAAPDANWIAKAAARFDVTMQESDEGGLALIGPYAAATLARAGLAADLEPLAFRKQFWRGLDVTLSRWGEHGGLEIWCKADDAVVVWDRLMGAGEAFGIAPVGLAAADLLDLEAGIARPGRDYAPVTSGDAVSPTPRMLGLESLIDEAHTGFNGRTAMLAAREAEPMRLVGIAIDSAMPAPHAPLMRAGRVVGRTLSSARSPALQQAIALGFVEAASVAPGTALSLSLPPGAEDPDVRTVAARVSDLPFLPAPDQIAP